MNFWSTLPTSPCTPVTCGWSAASGSPCTTSRWISPAARSPDSCGPVGLRQDHAHALDRRHPDRGVGDRDGLGHPAGSPRCVAASATSRRNRPSTTTCASSTTCGISPTCTALRPTPPPTPSTGGAVRPRPRLLRQPLRRAAHPGVAGVRIGIPARPAGARRTDRGTRPGAARRPVGAIPRTGAPRHHPAGVQPCHGRGPTTAPTCLLMREGRLLAHTTQPVARGHRMHITGGSVPVRHPAHHRSPSRLSPRAYLATTAGSCGNSPPTAEVSQ